MKSKLYKLAIWYIGKCNAEWNKHKYTDKVKSLNRLTYWNFGKYMLTYGADAEWQKFSRYEVLDNAIQRLAQYEENEQEIRNKALDEFAEAICNKVNENSMQIIVPDGFKADIVTIDYVSDVAIEIAEQLKGGAK